jgi:hypothetical protein
MNQAAQPPGAKPLHPPHFTDEVNGWAGKDLDLQIGPRKLSFTSETFILSFSLPHFHFHAVTAYDILRSRGVPSVSVITRVDCAQLDLGLRAPPRTG